MSRAQNTGHPGQAGHTAAALLLWTPESARTPVALRSSGPGRTRLSSGSLTCRLVLHAVAQEVLSASLCLSVSGQCGGSIRRHEFRVVTD